MLTLEINQELLNHGANQVGFKAIAGKNWKSGAAREYIWQELDK